MHGWLNAHSEEKIILVRSLLLRVIPTYSHLLCLVNYCGCTQGVRTKGDEEKKKKKRKTCFTGRRICQVGAVGQELVFFLNLTFFVLKRTKKYQNFLTYFQKFSAKINIGFGQKKWLILCDFSMMMIRMLNCSLQRVFTIIHY